MLLAAGEKVRACVCVWGGWVSLGYLLLIGLEMRPGLNVGFLLFVSQGYRAALPSATIMLRQPIQRFQQMQASDIDIYRTELRKTNREIVRPFSPFLVHRSYVFIGLCQQHPCPVQLLPLLSFGLQRNTLHCSFCYIS
jgi:hypothetical protein